MKNIWRIFVADLKCFQHNVIATVVLIGLLVTPVLYAWFNILGFWDPYSEAKNLEVAVANTDEGYSSDLIPTKINAGEEIISALRANDEFKWVFTDEEQAVSGAKSGEYYAALVIPKDFSADLMTVFSDQVKHANIIYYTNQKENAVAPRVTTEGADTLSGAINQTFTKTMVSVALDTTSDLIDFVNGDGFSNYARNLDQQLDKVIAELDMAATAAESFGDLADSTAELSRMTSGILSEVGTTSSTVGPILDQAETGVRDGKEALSAADGVMKTAFNRAEDKVNQIKQQLEDELKKFENNPAEKTNIDKIKEINKKIEEAKAEVQKIYDSYQAEITSRANALGDNLAGLKTSLTTMSGQIDEVSNRMAAASDSLANNLGSAGDSIGQTAEVLTEAATRLSETKTKLHEALNSGDMTMVRQIIGSSPENIASFIASPTELNRQPVFAVANNGSAFAPFYTSLSIWVGSVFMIALMETSVGRKRLATLENPKSGELYLGRYLIFLVLAMIQATLVCLGDVFFLGIQCEHVGLFFVTGWVAALVFSSIVYTLADLFGRVGESLAIILLVLQIAASGGIFPVVLSAPIFQALYPFLPFTYSLEAFQSAVAGVYGNQYWEDIGKLLLFVIPMLVLGLVLRRLVVKANDKLTAKMDETKIL